MINKPLLPIRNQDKSKALELIFAKDKKKENLEQKIDNSSQQNQTNPAQTIQPSKQKNSFSNALFIGGAAFAYSSALAVTYYASNKIQSPYIFNHLDLREMLMLSDVVTLPVMIYGLYKRFDKNPDMIMEDKIVGGGLGVVAFAVSIALGVFSYKIYDGIKYLIEK